MKNRDLKALNIILVSITGLILLLTTLYWIYYLFITDKVITASHGYFRQFIFGNFIREICILVIFLGFIISCVSLKWGNNKKVIFLYFIALLLELVLIDQLQIYQGP
jgi:cytochrome c biogenesis factor